MLYGSFLASIHHNYAQTDQEYPETQAALPHRAQSPTASMADGARWDTPGLQHVQGALWGATIPRQLLPPLPLDQLIVQDGRLLFPQQLQGFLVLLSQLLQGVGQGSHCWVVPDLGQGWGGLGSPQALWGLGQYSPHDTAVVSGPPGAARPPAMPSSAAVSSPGTCAPGDPAVRAGRTGLGRKQSVRASPSLTGAGGSLTPH